MKIVKVIASERHGEKKLFFVDTTYDSKLGGR